LFVSHLQLFLLEHALPRKEIEAELLRPQNLEDNSTGIAPEIDSRDKEDEQIQEESIEELHRPSGADGESSL